MPKYDYSSTSPLKNPMIPPVEQRPRCSHKGCRNPRAIISTLKDGSPNYRKVCDLHHRENLVKKNGLSSYSQLANSWHPYRKYRKDYCENKDKRLGFKCTTNIFWEGMLEVDHINGKHDDNRESNLQTLCKCCHAYKTNVFKDYRPVEVKKKEKRRPRPQFLCAA